LPLQSQEKTNYIAKVQKNSDL